MSTHLIPSDLLEFQLFDWLQIDSNSTFDRETSLATIDMISRFSADVLLSHWKENDDPDPKMINGNAVILPAAKQALKQYAELGLFGATFPEHFGGMGLSSALWAGMQSVMSTANPQTIGYAMLTGGNARVLLTHGTEKQIEQFALPEIEGRWFGTMCLSEPQAGSSLGDITTRATPDGEDELGPRYRITGNKMWISGGDQDASENIVHLVLAKAAEQGQPLPSGTRGISLFIVPKVLPNGERNDIALAGLNHKMGNRTMTNCLLNFGEKDGAIGWRVGEEGQGLAQMFVMMNDARVGVGITAASIAYRSYQLSVQYAKERKQGRKMGSTEKHSVPILEHADVRRMLLQQKTYAEAGLAICFYSANLIDQDTEAARSLLELLTPIAKSWCSEFGSVASDLGIQIHGGYGYTRDFDVEQLWRDNRLNRIHEGTTGIQAMDLLGRKLLHSDGKPLAQLKSKLSETLGKAKQHATFTSSAHSIEQYWQGIDATLHSLSKVKDGSAYNDATLFLNAFGHGIAAWLLLDMLVAAERVNHQQQRESLFYSLQYFVESELTIATGWLAVVDAHSTLVATVPDSVFG